MVIPPRTDDLLKATRWNDVRRMAKCIWTYDADDLPDDIEQCDIDDHDLESGQTALMIAAELGKLEAAEWLIQKEADITRQDDRGWTALHYAVANNRTTILKLLVERATTSEVCEVQEVFAPNDAGDTPLHFTVSTSRKALKLAKILLSGGARIGAVNKAGKRPFDVAEEKGLGEVAALLVARIERMIDSALDAIESDERPRRRERKELDSDDECEEDQACIDAELSHRDDGDSDSDSDDQVADSDGDRFYDFDRSTARRLKMIVTLAKAHKLDGVRSRVHAIVVAARRRRAQKHLDELNSELEAVAERRLELKKLLGKTQRSLVENRTTGRALRKEISEVKAFLNGGAAPQGDDADGGSCESDAEAGPGPSVGGRRKRRREMAEDATDAERLLVAIDRFYAEARQITDRSAPGPVTPRTM